jgi:GNAT superfamily N-acetyltransferase
MVGGRLGDVLGDLLRAGDGVLVVRTRHGVVEVAEADVVVGKAVPPPPVRTAAAHQALSTSALELLAADHWRAARTERLGEWLLRADGGFTGRANSVLPVGDPGLPPNAAIEAVADWYAQHRLPAMACLPAGRAGDPDAQALAATRTAFARAGWVLQAGAGAEVLTAATGALRGDRPPEGLDVTLLDAPDEEWLTVYNYRGRPLSGQARRLLSSAPDQVFATVRDGGRTVAVARGSLAHGWAGITALEVAQTHRRGGLARAMIASLAAWAWRRGAGSVFVQVGDGNDTALTLYAGCGFRAHHHYDYLARPGS